jgi:hypothetical protein
MKPLPLPLRVAAGLAVSTAERVRELPKQLTGLPVTVVSQVLQFSMRVQQHVTELAIKGDDALSSLRPVEDTPSWATFDEDVEPDLSKATTPDNVTSIKTAESVPRNETNGHRPAFTEAESEAQSDTDAASDPWAEEERALSTPHAEGEFDAPVTSSPAGVVNYDELTLPQLRARLRRFSLPELEELLTYERANADRPSFVGMLARRIGNVNQAGTDDDSTGR